jgi:hypothetical protein
MEEVRLVPVKDIKAELESRRGYERAAGASYDSEEEEMGGGGQRVSCAQQ